MISVVIPTLNEEKQIGNIIRYLRTKPMIDDVIIVDDGSIDRTVEIAKKENALVILSSMLGKGSSMSDGLRRAKNDIVLFLDGDIYNFADDLVEKMIAPLQTYSVDFVKGAFKRAAGRVTELTAKPLLQTFFPELLRFEQPLGGIMAGRKSFLEKMTLENDYSVDVGLLIDLHQFGARVAEVHVGHIEHEHQSLNALSRMAFQIVRCILDRAANYKRLNHSSISQAIESERTAGLRFSTILDRVSEVENLILFDMDGTLIEGSFIEYLANMAGKRDDLKGFLGNHELDAVYRTRMIAKALEGIPRSMFEQVASAAPLKPFAKETVIALRKSGFKVGIVTDSYFVAAEIIRRRVFADFSIAHKLEFVEGKATGQILISPFMELDGGCISHTICKANFVRHLNAYQDNSSRKIFSVGNGLNDICLFRASHKSFAVYPERDEVTAAASRELSSLADIPQAIGF